MLHAPCYTPGPGWRHTHPRLFVLLLPYVVSCLMRFQKCTVVFQFVTEVAPS